jgi:hypothetical protein
VKFAKPYSKNQTAEYKFFAAQLDKSGKVIGEPLLIFEELLERDVRKSTFYSKNSKVILSTDSTKLLAFSGNIIKGKLNNKILNHQLKVIGSKTIQLPTTKTSYWSNFILDEKDNIYCTSKEKSDEPKKFNYKLHCFNIKTNTVKSKNIEVKSSYPLSLLHLNKYQDKLQFVAYYYNATKQKTLGGGIVFHEFNANSLDVITSNENEFDSGIIEKLNSSGVFKKSNLSYDSVNTINSLINTKIVNLQNNQIYVVSEQLALLESNASIGHDYLNILVTKINKEGLQNTCSVIPKLQSGGTKSYYSFLDIVRNNKLYLIINDNSRNLGLKDPYKLENGLVHVTGSCSIIVSIDEKGDWKKRLFYTVNEGSSYLFPSMYYFKNPNSIFIYGKKENMIRFANIDLGN